MKIALEAVLALATSFLPRRDKARPAIQAHVWSESLRPRLSFGKPAAPAQLRQAQQPGSQEGKGSGFGNGRGDEALAAAAGIADDMDADAEVASSRLKSPPVKLSRNAPVWEEKSSWG